MILILIIAASITSGSLAYYTFSLNNFEDGQSYAKNFILTGEGNETFSQDLKIAPTETNTQSFSVANFDGDLITETNMDLKITVELAAADGKNAIPYLTAIIKKDGQQVGSGDITNGRGIIDVEDYFLVANGPQTYVYDVEITWPDNGVQDNNNNMISDDAEYGLEEFGNKLIMSVKGVQSFHSEQNSINNQQ